MPQPLIQFVKCARCDFRDRSNTFKYCPNDGNILNTDFETKADREKARSGELIVAMTEDGQNVVINHPDLEPDAEGCGHIVFSPDQARNLAWMLFLKANIVEGLICANCNNPITQEGGWATAIFRYCFKDECQQEFCKEAQAMIRKVDPETADRLAAAVKIRPGKVTATVASSSEVFNEIYKTHFPQSERPLTDAASLPASFTCPKCGAVSYNKNDVEQRYCGKCHEFFDEKG
jgi:hypothetical protein